jgi:hypothetical protein
MALFPFIHDRFVPLIAMALLPFSSWHHHPCCNGVVVIIDVIALVAHRQAGVVPGDAQASSPLSQW